MVKLIVGNRGTGKTKRLIADASQAVEESLGHVVCIEKGDALSLNLKASEIRLIDIDEYFIKGPEAYYGFISGLLAGNYDITHIYCDATYKIICGDTKDPEVLEKFINTVDSLGKLHDCIVTFSVSTSEEELPESLKEMVI